MKQNLQEQINKIIADRKQRLSTVEEQKKKWTSIAENLDQLTSAMRTAEGLNPDTLRGMTEKIVHASSHASEEAGRFRHIVERFGRNDICIGIGGAGRMGKSTFLQAVTGLGEEQIPTSDMFYTTAGRSLIVNAPQAVAIADMHTVASFLENVIAPMYKAIKERAPISIEEFQRMQFSEGTTQAQIDVINRLEDTKRALPSILPELTGEKNRHIEIAKLHDYVAYPADGKSKAGKFMAVANIVIYAPFPYAEVQQLRVVDLPGLGEAGRELAEVQTSGMSEICDITLLMKRPDEKSVAWNLNDTEALDAMKKAAPLLDDQTKYTAILANVNGEPSVRADACVEDISLQLSKHGRNFQIIRCNAKDRESVLNETMPKVLDFLANNLSGIDNALFEKAASESEKAKDGILATLLEAKGVLAQLTRASNGSLIAFQEQLYDRIVKSLSEYAGKLRGAAEHPDEEWNNEVLRVTEKVKSWIANGCGYGSSQELTQKIADEILAVKGQPSNAINQLRIAFREQWEMIDDHLQNRIANVLEGFIQTVQSCTSSFIPNRKEGLERIVSLRVQLKDFAEKLMQTPDQDPDDDIALKGLATPLLRLSEFDLRFRFHLEPTLIAATEVLISNELPLVKDEKDAATFTKTVMDILNTKAAEYSKTMSTTRGGNAALEKKKRLIEGAVKDAAVRKELISMLEGVMTSSQTFSPNRIFAAVIENAVDSFLRFKDHNRAYQVWVRGYESELREQPKPAMQAALDAYVECSSILKKLQ